MILAVLAGCASLPFVNDPPVLLAVDGEPVAPTPQGRFGDWSAGSVYLPVGDVPSVDLQVAAIDAEGDAFETWFPDAPGTMRFDPAGRSGTWFAPEGVAFHRHEFDLVLREVDPPFRSTWYQVYLEESADSGDSGNEGRRP